MKRVFLSGTCNNSKWREILKPMLNIDYFDPLVKDWTEEWMAEEIKQRETCDFCLYVITPKMTGVYSIAEVVDDSNKRPEKTIFCILEEDFDASLRIPDIPFETGQMESLMQVSWMVIENGSRFFTSLTDVAEYLNLQSVDLGEL